MIQLLVAGNPQLDLDAFLEALAGKVDHVRVTSLCEAARCACEGTDVVLLECREEPPEALRALREMRSAVATAGTPVLALAGPVEAIEALGAGVTAISRRPSDPALVAEEVQRLTGKGAEGKTDLELLPDFITLELPERGLAEKMADLMGRGARLVLQVAPDGLRLVVVGEEPVVLDVPTSLSDGPLVLNAGIRWAVATGGELVAAYPIHCIEVYSSLPCLDEFSQEAPSLRQALRRAQEGPQDAAREVALSN